ncbi:MAG: DNA-directed RNA polymerase subunit alpha C-terminal domain-containing protein [Flavisolibacter sp.]|jgi:DNA-directed RNA polymerase alpha subunit
MENQFTIQLTHGQLAQMIQNLSEKECRVLIRLLQIKITRLTGNNPGPELPLPLLERDYLDRPLTSFNLSGTIATRLRNAGYVTVRDVVEGDYRKLMVSRNIGATTWKELKAKVIDPYLGY